MKSCTILFLHFSLLKAFLKFVFSNANFRFKWFPTSRLMIWIQLWAAHFFILLFSVVLTCFFTCITSFTLKNLTVQIYEKFNAKMIHSYFYKFTFEIDSIAEIREYPKPNIVKEVKVRTVNYKYLPLVSFHSTSLVLFGLLNLTLVC